MSSRHAQMNAYIEQELGLEDYGEESPQPKVIKELKKFTIEEINEYHQDEGTWDDYGFYNFTDGAFYDPNGIYFDKDG